VSLYIYQSLKKSEEYVKEICTPQYEMVLLGLRRFPNNLLGEVFRIEGHKYCGESQRTVDCC